MCLAAERSLSTMRPSNQANGYPMDAAVKDIAAQAQRIQRRHSHTASQLKLTGTITSTRAAVMALAPLPVVVPLLV